MSTAAAGRKEMRGTPAASDSTVAAPVHTLDRKVGSAARRRLPLQSWWQEEAVENEDFAEAAKLKRAILEAIGNDDVSHIMAELKSATEEQRYQDVDKACWKLEPACMRTSIFVLSA